MSELPSAIIAGSTSFVQALQSQLRLRLGALPGVAHDPAEALATAGNGGLFVVECSSPPWVEAVRSLRGRCAPGVLSIVAAVPPGSAAEVQPLRSAGADEVVAWQGRADPVVWAVERVVARARAAGPATSGAGAEQRGAPPAAAPVTAPPAQVFDELEVVDGTPLPLDEPGAARAAPERAGDAAAGDAAVSAPPPAWPNAVPTAMDAEMLLIAAAAGHLPPEPLRAPIERVMAALTTVERLALMGGPAPDPAVLRCASGCRVRIAVALATAPAEPGSNDQGAAEQLLADVDGVLLAVKNLAALAGVDAADVAALRHALVDGGVELAGVVSRTAQQSPPAAETTTSAKATARARMLSMTLGSDESRTPWQRTVLIIVLATSVAAAAAFHGSRVYWRPTPELPTYPGAPEGLIAVPAAPGQTMLISHTGHIDPEQLKRFTAQQESTGMSVRQIGPGTLLVVPRPAASAADGTHQGAAP
jgi:hypothetical protein